MKCPKCKKSIPNKCKFCPECGADIKEAIYALLAPYSNPTSLVDIIAMPSLPEEWMDIIYTPEERKKLNDLCARLDRIRLNQATQDSAKSILQPVKHSPPPVVKASKPVEKRNTKDGTVDSARNRECPQKRSWFGSLFRKLFQ